MGCEKNHNWSYSDPCPYCEIEDVVAENAKLHAEVERLKVLASHNSMPTCMEGCDSPALYCDCVRLQVDEMSKRIYKIGLLCDAVPGLQSGFCPDIGEPRDNLTRIKIAMERFTEKRVEGPRKIMHCKGPGCNGEGDCDCACAPCLEVRNF